MKAMVLKMPGMPLVMEERPNQVAGRGQIMLKIEACAVCRTDLHVVDGELDHPKLPLVPGHEIVGIVEAVGQGGDTSRLGRRVGVPWLGHTCRPAMERVYPALTSQFILLMLASSVTSQISAEELTAAGNFIQSETYRPFETYLVIAVIYLFLSLGMRALFWGLGMALFPRRRRLGTPL